MTYYNNRNSERGQSQVKLIKTGVGVVAALITLGIASMFVHTVTVEPGKQLVINDKPYFFGSSGIRPEPITEGRKFLFATSSATVFPAGTAPQSISIPLDDFSSRDNILLDFETTIQFVITDAPKLASLGDNWFDNNVRRQYIAIVREEVKRRTMQDMMSNPVTAQEVDDAVTAKLEELIATAKLPIRLVGISLGRARPNDIVLSQMNETAAQQQRELTIAASELNERRRENEQKAKARADNAYRQDLGLTADQYIQIEQIRQFAEVCKGSTTCVINVGGAGGVNKLIK